MAEFTEGDSVYISTRDSITRATVTRVTKTQVIVESRGREQKFNARTGQQVGANRSGFAPIPLLEPRTECLDTRYRRQLRRSAASALAEAARKFGGDRFSEHEKELAEDVEQAYATWKKLADD